MIRMFGYLPKQRSWPIKAAWVLSMGIFVGHCSTVFAASVVEIALYRGKDREQN